MEGNVPMTFVVLKRREWDRGVGHRGNDIHERHFRYDAGIEVVARATAVAGLWR
jgi:hypothetical protein